MKNIIMLIAILFSFNAFAIDPEEVYKKNKVENFKDELIASILSPNDRIKTIKTLSIIRLALENTNEYDYYKKYLLEMNAMLILKSSFYPENKDVLIGIAKEMFGIQLCTSYMFRNYAATAVSEIENLVLYDEDRKNGYKGATSFFYSEKIVSLFKEFVQKNKNNLGDICV